MKSFARINVAGSEADALLQFVSTAESSQIETEAIPDGLQIDWQVVPFIHETIRLGFFLWGRYKSYVMLLLGISIVLFIVKWARGREPKKMKAQ